MPILQQVIPPPPQYGNLKIPEYRLPYNCDFAVLPAVLAAGDNPDAFHSSYFPIFSPGQTVKGAIQYNTAGGYSAGKYISPGGFSSIQAQKVISWTNANEETWEVRFKVTTDATGVIVGFDDSSTNYFWLKYISNALYLAIAKAGNGWYFAHQTAIAVDTEYTCHIRKINLAGTNTYQLFINGALGSTAHEYSLGTFDNSIIGVMGIGGNVTQNGIGSFIGNIYSCIHWPQALTDNQIAAQVALPDHYNLRGIEREENNTLRLESGAAPSAANPAISTTVTIPTDFEYRVPANIIAENTAAGKLVIPTNAKLRQDGDIINKSGNALFAPTGNNIQVKQSEIFVDDFIGSVPSWVDVTSQINAAIAIADGREIRFKKSGPYRITGSLNVGPLHALKMSGRGNTVINCYGVTGYVFAPDETAIISDFKMNGLIFEGKEKGIGDPSTTWDGIWQAKIASLGLNWQDVRIQNSNKATIGVLDLGYHGSFSNAGCALCKFKNVTIFMFPYGRGIWIGATYFESTTTHFEGCQLFGLREGYNISRATEISFVNCCIDEGVVAGVSGFANIIFTGLHCEGMGHDQSGTGIKTGISPKNVLGDSIPDASYNDPCDTVYTDRNGELTFIGGMPLVYAYPGTLSAGWFRLIGDAGPKAYDRYDGGALHMIGVFGNNVQSPNNTMPLFADEPHRGSYAISSLSGCSSMSPTFLNHESDRRKVSTGFVRALCAPCSSQVMEIKGGRYVFGADVAMPFPIRPNLALLDYDYSVVPFKAGDRFRSNTVLFERSDIVPVEKIVISKTMFSASITDFLFSLKTASLSSAFLTNARSDGMDLKAFLSDTTKLQRSLHSFAKTPSGVVLIKLSPSSSVDTAVQFESGSNVSIPSNASPTGIYAYLPMTEGTGNPADIMGHLTPTIGGSGGAWEANQGGSDPTLQHLNATANTLLNLGSLDALLNTASEFTLFITMKLSSNIGYAFFCTDAQIGTYLYIDCNDSSSGIVNFFMRDGIHADQTSSFPIGSLPTGQWISLAIVFNGNLSAGARVAQYVNGAAMTVTNTGIQAVAPAFLHGYNVTVGNTAATLPGKYGPMMFCNKALSADEVAAYHNNLASVTNYLTVTDAAVESGKEYICTSEGYDAPTWTPGNAVLQNDVIRGTSGSHVYQAQGAGTTHSSTEPTWPTGSGSTVGDNDITWKEIGLQAQFQSIY